MARIGVLALQGAFAAHGRMLERLGHEPVWVRTASDLAGIDGLVLPGGESTTHLKLLTSQNLKTPLREWIATGKPILATCAGAILAAKEVTPEQESFAWIDITVQRNAWGRQIASFEAVADTGHPLVFIRAPRIERVGENVDVLASLQGEPIMVKQGNCIAATFHPELTDDDWVHRTVFGVVK